jgi:hypothetical protein
VRTCGEELDGPNVQLTGSYQVRLGRVSGRLVGALPRVLVVRHTGQLCPVLDLTVAEVERAARGRLSVAFKRSTVSAPARTAPCSPVGPKPFTYAGCHPAH